MVCNHKQSPLFVFPDPVTGPEMLSGAALLYFKQLLWLTSPPLVVTQGSEALLPLIRQRRPEWGDIFFALFEAWLWQLDASRKTLDAIAPLKDKSFKVMWLSYPADLEALERSNTLVASAGFSLDSMASVINPLHASGEIIRHIMLGAFLQLDQDIEALFDYCGDLFTRERLEHLLAKGYLLRLQMLTQMQHASVLLTNERLTGFLGNLPIQSAAEATEEVDNDVIAWELFRQILSPRLDPLNGERAALIAELLDSRGGEIERLRLKCSALAEQVRQPGTLRELDDQIETLIRTHVDREIADLLQLDRQALEAFLTAVFSDEKTWAAVLAFIASVATGHVYLTVGSAIAALSSVGAKAFKAAADRRQKLKQSDYALVYTIRRKA